MRRLLAVLGICAFAPGCNTLCTTARTAVVEPLQYGVHRQERRTAALHGRLADRAWEAIRAANPAQRFTIHYMRGFKSGFADYLTLGGTGAPPPIPPRHYWKLRYQTPAGHAAIQDWYTGFHDGVAEARGSGYREGRTVPSSLESCTATCADDACMLQPPLGLWKQPAIGMGEIN